MNGLLLDGFNLMLVGMGMVFAFLVLLVFATAFMSKLVLRYMPEPAVTLDPTPPSPASKPSEDAQLMAVITAA
ncbi:MAG: hypothetical protein CUN56_16045, partial [Phototrophicales bacterium]